MSYVLNLEEIQALANSAAETGLDMTEVVKGGGGGKILPTDRYAFARLVEYIEFGNQPQEYQGKAKDPAPEIQLGFALYGEGFQNDDGTPYLFRPYSMALSQNEKAKAHLLFKLLNWQGTKKHFGQMLNDFWLVKFETKEPKAGTQGKPKSQMMLNSFIPPLDPVTRAPYSLPATPMDMFRVFFWDNPRKEHWDALFVEGKFDNGDSKNRLQEKILSATNFDGSPIHMLLATAGIAFEKPAKPAAPAAPAVPAAAPAVAAAVPNVAPAQPAVAPASPVVAAAVPVASAPVATPPFDPSPNGQPQQVVTPTAPATVAAPAAVVAAPAVQVVAPAATVVAPPVNLPQAA